MSMPARLALFVVLHAAGLAIPLGLSAMAPAKGTPQTTTAPPFPGEAVQIVAGF